MQCWCGCRLLIKIGMVCAKLRFYVFASSCWRSRAQTCHANVLSWQRNRRFKSSTYWGIDVLVPIDSCHSFTASIHFALTLHPLWYLWRLPHPSDFHCWHPYQDLLFLDTFVTCTIELFSTIIKLPTKTRCDLSSTKGILK